MQATRPVPMAQRQEVCPYIAESPQPGPDRNAMARRGDYIHGRWFWQEQHVKFVPADLAYELAAKLTEAAPPDSNLAREDQRRWLRTMIDALPRREREVMTIYYGLGQHSPCSLRDVGTILGITPERVRQVRARALRRLQRRLGIHPVHALDETPTSLQSTTLLPTGTSMFTADETNASATGLLPNADDLADSNWRAAPAEQLDRLKLEGIALRQRTPGRFMLRLRIPAGRLTSAKARAIGEAARAFAGNRLDITARAQLQLHGIEVHRVDALVRHLRAADVTSRLTLADGVRNIRSCPLAELSPCEAVSAQGVIERIDQNAMNDPALADLPRKVNIAVTGCTHQCCDAAAQDIALVPAEAPRSEHSAKPAESRMGFNILVGGKISAGDCHIARPLDVWSPAEQAHEVVLALLHLYAAHGPRQRRTASRLVYLVEAWGVDRLRNAVEQRVGQPLERAGRDLRNNRPCTSLGLNEQKQPGRVAVGLHVPVGVLSGTSLMGVADLADEYGQGQLRLTSEQSIVLPDIDAARLDQLQQTPLLRRLSPRPLPILSGVQSCTGAAYCSLAVIETKDYALTVANELARRMPTLPRLRIYWSGCRAGCGQHAIADVGLVGRKTTVNGEKVDAVDVYVGGSAQAQPAISRKVRSEVPVAELADVLESLIRQGLVPISDADSNG